MTIPPSSPDMGGCPFCGSKDVELLATASHWPAVGCNECGALGPCTDLHSDKAIEAWNARAGVAQSSAQMSERINVIVRDYGLEKSSASETHDALIAALGVAQAPLAYRLDHPMHGVELSICQPSEDWIGRGWRVTPLYACSVPSTDKLPVVTTGLEPDPNSASGYRVTSKGSGRQMSEAVKRALYFGCRGANEPGHYLQEGRKTIWDTPPEISFWDRVMDGGFLKNGKRPDVCDGKVYWTCGGRPDFWYAFYWWDNSGDRRPGSNSGFYVGGFGPEVITPETAREHAALAFAYACEQYPWVIERQRHPLSLQHQSGAE